MKGDEQCEHTTKIEHPKYHETGMTESKKFELGKKMWKENKKRDLYLLFSKPQIERHAEKGVEKLKRLCQ